ncbi:MAG: hypothetical protein M1822_006013 [Bathelium mastoideum]|nr:MAG: hypothetical protein M1822_006013 [Bathelium mastoideum]
MPSKQKYTLIPSQLENTVDPNEQVSQTFRRRPRFENATLVTVLLVASTVVGFLVGVLWQSQSLFVSKSPTTAEPAVTSCKHPVVRREWRSLSVDQKRDYSRAVNCLRETPSRLGLNQSLYDDFPYVHSRIGEYCKTIVPFYHHYLTHRQAHGAAAFLAWHRIFVQTYENALREQCQYQGWITYWNWALDWNDIRKSPVWSNDDTGFGTDGDPAVGEEILKGHCVVDGPFANLSVLYLDEKDRPHCLSRGFNSGKDLMKYGSMLQPSELEKLLEDPNYRSFNLRLENSAHIAIPRSIRGDFSMLTAPYDPVFLLHHTQLDRLWWLWQTANESERKWQYEGSTGHNETDNSASLDDTLPLGGLAPDVKVSDIIDTQGNLLCYRYSVS